MATRTDRPARPGAQEWVPDDPQAGVPDLKQAATECRGCELWEPATQVVFSAGRADAPMMLVGEQPGDVEDQRGIPFVGPAGKLLQDCLQEAGIGRDAVYVTNAVKHFRYTPRGKRRIHEKPDAGHVNACRPWLTRELEVVDPDVVVILGATAALSLMGRDFRITKQRGEVIEHEFATGVKQVVATVHPSSILRTPPEERAAARAGFVADLTVAAALLKG